MISMSKSLAGLMAVAAAVVLGGAPKAEAGFQVTFMVDGAFHTVVDGGGDDVNGAAGKITVLGVSVGGYSFNVTLATTNSPTGGGTISFVESGTNEIINDLGGATGAVIRIVASANGFTAPTAPPPLNAISGSTAQFLAGSNTGNSAAISYVANAGPGNTLQDNTNFGTGTLIGSGGPTLISAPGGNTNLSDTDSIAILSAPYSLSLVLTADFSDTNSGVNRIDLDGTLELTAVPEPSTLAAAAAGLPLLGAFWLRRKSRRSA